jgi:L-asparaginase II
MSANPLNADCGHPSSGSGADPVAVLVRRGDRIESVHRVVYAVADAGGALPHHEGDVWRPVFPRSSAKPLQALPLVESGAAERFALGEQELALACASHGGEPMHTEIVAAWLARIGLDPSALECGAHAPSHEPSAQRLIAQGRSPSPLHNNCSGKHAGMLTLALHLGAPVAGYIAPDHPVQQRISAALAAMSGAPLTSPAIDGCGVPAHAMPLAGLATAMARLADPGARFDQAGRAEACARIRAAMAGHPLLVAGSGRACSLIMAAAPGVLVKTGAEGVYVAALPDQKLGVALKVADGAGRAAVVALMALLARLGALDPTAAALGDLAAPLLRNHAGRLVGRVEPAPGWPSFDPPAAPDPRHQA